MQHFSERFSLLYTKCLNTPGQEVDEEVLCTLVELRNLSGFFLWVCFWVLPEGISISRFIANSSAVVAPVWGHHPSEETGFEFGFIGVRLYPTTLVLNFPYHFFVYHLKLILFLIKAANWRFSFPHPMRLIWDFSPMAELNYQLAELIHQLAELFHQLVELYQLANKINWCILVTNWRN